MIPGHKKKHTSPLEHLRWLSGLIYTYNSRHVSPSILRPVHCGRRSIRARLTSLTPHKDICYRGQPPSTSLDLNISIPTPHLSVRPYHSLATRHYCGLWLTIGHSVQTIATEWHISNYSPTIPHWHLSTRDNIWIWPGRYVSLINIWCVILKLTTWDYNGHLRLGSWIYSSPTSCMPSISGAPMLSPVAQVMFEIYWLQIHLISRLRLCLSILTVWNLQQSN